MADEEKRDKKGQDKAKRPRDGEASGGKQGGGKQGKRGKPVQVAEPAAAPEPRESVTSRRSCRR